MNKTLIRVHLGAVTLALVWSTRLNPCRPTR